MSKKTIVLGASPNAERYSNKATLKLLQYGHEVYPFGIRKGKINNLEIQQKWPEAIDVHTVAMYIRPCYQGDYFDEILKSKPKRIIFNPGTFNSQLAEEAKKNNIEIVDGCVLLMLHFNEY